MSTPRHSPAARHLIATFVAAVIAFGLPGLGSTRAATDESTRYYERAQSYLAKGELQAAIIELKNSVRADPENGKARYALGVALLGAGDASSAQRELKAAGEHGIEQDRLVEPLARSFLMQGDYQALLDTVVLKDQNPVLAAEILSWRGYALMGLGRQDAAEKEFAEAIQRNPKGSRGYTGLAYLLMRRGDLAGAERQTDTALSIAPDLPDTLAIKGELRRIARDPTTALPYFDKAVAGNPTNLVARTGRAALYVERDELDKAQADVDVILKLSEGSVAGQYLQALILAKRRDLQAAINVLARNSAGLDSYPPALKLLAALYAGQGQLEQAETYIRRYLAAVPGDGETTRQLAGILLKKGQPAAAIAVLKKAIEAAPQDSQLSGLLAVAYLRNGQAAQSSEWFDKAAAAAPNDPAMRTKVAVGRLEAGQLDAAVKDLQAAIDLGSDSIEARILLVLTDLRRKDFDQALATTMALKAKMPGSPVPDNLLGAIEFARNNRAAARARFEDALKIAPDFQPSQMNLAGLELADGKIDAARQRYAAIVKANPATAVPAMLAIARIDFQRGQADQAEASLVQAAKTDPTAVAPQIALVDLYLKQHRIREAGAPALTLQQIGADNLQAQDAVMRTQIAAGDTASALTTLRRMITLAPNSPALQDGLARMLQSDGDEVGARAAFDAAINLDDGYLPARIGRLALEVRAGRVAEALSTANAWRSQHPGQAAGDVLVGTVLANAGRYDDAAAAYGAAVAKEASSENVVRQYDATLKAGMTKEAVEGLTSWLDRHPDDQLVRFSLASALIETKRYPEAQTQYELLIGKDPENPVILNNLAWLYANRGDKRSIDYAEHAYRLSPDTPAIADTLGFILVGKGETDRGLMLLSQAHDKMPNSPETTYHLAVALKSAGRGEEARTMLTQLLASSTQFDGRSDAEALKKQLEAH